MTAESNTPGIIAPLPVWLYWVIVSLTAGLPVLIASGILPDWGTAIAAMLNAMGAALIGVSRPAPSVERVAIAAEAKRRSELPQG